MNILVTGFEPFQNNQENPTQEIVRLLPKGIKGHKIIPIELPVLYNESFSRLKTEIEIHKPDVVICLGLAAGRKGITPERVAINVNDSTHPDNSGTVYIDEIIIEEGNNAYFSTLPIREMITIMNEKKIDCSISNSAGLYVCNDIMYRLLHYIDENKLNIMAGFIHVPLMSEQEHKNLYHMPLPQILEGIIDSIKTCL